MSINPIVPTAAVAIVSSILGSRVSILAATNLEQNRNNSKGWIVFKKTILNIILLAKHIFITVLTYQAFSNIKIISREKFMTGLLGLSVVWADTVMNMALLALSKKSIAS